MLFRTKFHIRLGNAKPFKTEKFTETEENVLIKLKEKYMSWKVVNRQKAIMCHLFY